MNLGISSDYSDDISLHYQKCCFVEGDNLKTGEFELLRVQDGIEIKQAQVKY